jgi:two-component system CheB/CheR fusion protein
VLEIADDIIVQPDHIYIIPSNKMMIANDGVLELTPRPAKNKNERNLPIDLFFTSLAEVHQSHAIGIVLSGTASDGTQGLKAIKDHGGITFAQDEESAAYDGMPHSAAQAGVVDFILPPEKIPQKLLEVVHIIKTNSNGHGEENLPLQDEDVFKQILSLLRIRKGTDFTYYKQTTIRRRILRRMAISKSDKLATYIKLLRENKTEQDILYQDLLIPVTGFFRDPKTFDNLCESVFPLIVKNKVPGETIRMWVAGCSTGEEAYSIAICLKEFLEDSSQSGERVQIFATDISEPAIAKARAGIYTKSDIEGLSPQRLKEFFIKTNGSYQANKSIRDLCVFAVHNFLKDPPFGKMDFISCRNVLIYMEPYLQKKALTTFHYSLNPKGILLLGKSETTGGVPELFVQSQAKEGKNDKLFTRKDVPGRFMHIASQRSEQNLSDTDINTKSDNIRTDFQKTADDIMLSKYTPAGVVVNEAMDIVHFRGNTGNYLQQLPGKPSHNLLKMAKEGLAFELRNILHKTKKAKQPVIKENIPIHINGSLQNISIEALLLPNTIEPHYLVLFHDNPPLAISREPLVKGKAKATSQQLTANSRIAHLEKELSQSREDMRSITEDQEAANEELQSANEELLSSSEELQSLNEELETGKEELQSTNEELMVVNQEMVSLNELVTASRDYAEAIILNIREPLLVLDKNLRIKTANNAFYKTFRVNEKETEGVLIYNIGNKQWDIPALRLLLEKILPEKSVFNDFEVSHTFSSIGERVMLLNAREVINKNSSEKLILLSIEDITERKKAEDVVRKSNEHFRHLVKELPAAVYSCDALGCLTFYNNAAAKLLGYKPEIDKDKWNSNIKMFYPDGLPLPVEKAPMSRTLKEGIKLIGEEFIIERPDGTRSNVLANPQPEFSLTGEITGAINMLFDVTEQVNAKNIFKESEEHFKEMAELMPQKVWTSDAEGNKNYFNKTLLDYAGKSFEELKGVGWENIMHPDDWEKNKKLWEESIRTGKNYEAENRLLRKDGKYFWHLTRAVAIKDDDGKIKMWVGSKTEIQEQQEHKEALEKAVEKRTSELKEANKELLRKNIEIEDARKKLLSEYARSLIEASLDPMITINPEGKITDMNQAAVDITSLSREKLMGTDFFTYYSDQQKAKELQQDVFTKMFITDFPLTILDGRHTDVLFNGSVYKDESGKVIGAVFVARDFSEQKRIEKELTEAKVFAELATVMAEDAKTKAEIAMQAKQQFLSNMSHEIRTPMNAIIGFTKVILKTDLTGKQKEYLNAIKLSGDALIVLINDILDLAKVDAGKMTFEQVPFKMALSISAMLHLFETKIQEKNLKLEVEFDKKIPEVLLGDPVRLHQVIINLVSNAVKFTSAGKINVSVQLRDEDEENVTIEFIVTDTGIGILPSKMETIFENFQQASSGTSRLYGGTGLGLAIVKQLVESQGGTISVKSKPGEGSIFSFTLSFQKTNEAAEMEAAIAETYEENKNIKVLVVEDIALNQLLMKTLLDDFGFERDVADNGRIAIEKLKAKTYDIILMDLQMPEMNGFETTEYIRNTMSSKIPIIALTADVTTVDLAKCNAAGMNDYIAKPIDEKLLFTKIIGLVKKNQFANTDKTNGDTRLHNKTGQGNGENKKPRCTDLTYLMQHTKSNPNLIMEMISLYLKQTPPLVTAMKQGLLNKDFDVLYAAVHKMIPSFSIMGISEEYENMAKKIQESARTQKNDNEMRNLVLQVAAICEQACTELEIEFYTIKNTSL